MKTIRCSSFLVVLFIVIIDINHNSLSAQSLSCQERYNIALEYYEKGRIDSTYQILLLCINDKKELRSVSKNDRGKIFKLAAEAAFYLGLYDEAELYAKDFREIHPLYSPQDDDLLEFQDNVKSSGIYPKTTVGFKIIYSRTKPELITYLSPYEIGYGEFYHYNTLLLGLQFKRYIRRRIAIGTELIHGKFITYDLYGYDSYDLNISTLEIPVYCTYNLVNRKSILTYLELGLSVIFPMNPILTWGSDFTTFKSDNFGKYYFVFTHDESVGHFFDNSLNYNLITGVGTSFRIGVINIGLNFRYFPKLIRNDPFEGITSFNDIPEDDDLYYYNDIYLYRIQGHYQLSLIFGLSLNYQAY